MTDVLTLTLRRNEVRNQILDCQKCDLRANAREPVPFRGRVPSKIFFFAEAPGSVENKYGKPMIGPAGQIFEGILRDVGLSKSQDWFIANSVCCKPSHNDKPTADQIVACRDNLRSQIQLADPEWVVPLGNIALTALALGLKGVGITKIRGKPFEIPMGPAKGRMGIATFHPSAALRDQSGKIGNMMRADLDLLRRFLVGEIDWRIIGLRIGARGTLTRLSSS